MLIVMMVAPWLWSSINTLRIYHRQYDTHRIQHYLSMRCASNRENDAVIYAFALAMAVQTDSPPLELHLICTGAGQQEKATNNSAYARDNMGNSATVAGNGSRSVAFEDQVRIDIAGAGGRIRVPQAMLPMIRGGKDGWFELRDITATPDEIHAIATINLLNKVKLRIDRLTGTASFTVKQGQFAGRCTPYDPGTVQRAF